MNKEDRINYYRPLTQYPNHEEALHLLKKLAIHVRPIMEKRNWRVGTLEEFWPADRGLLGLNRNRGEIICIRLRPHYDEGRFYDFNDLIGTMLHELTHIECGPHDAAFYKLLDELNDEYDDLLIKGYSGFNEGFFGDGYRLGQGISHNVSPALARQKALEEAEKRRKIEGLMTKGGRRLGGGERHGLSLRELAAMAAERRRRDNLWCGNEKPNSNSNNLGVYRPTFGSTTKPISAVRVPPNKIPGLSRISALPDTKTGEWTCSSCTLVNRPMALQCDVCLAERPYTNDTSPFSSESVIIIDNDNFPKPSSWNCPRCTFGNAPDIVMCLGCDYWKG